MLPNLTETNINQNSIIMRKLFTFLFAGLLLTATVSAQFTTGFFAEKQTAVPQKVIKYSPAPSVKATLLSENFEGAALPTGWTNTYGSATYGWQFGTSLGSSYWPIPAHTTYAAANDDACNCTMSDVNLTTTAVDLSSGNARLRLDYMNSTYSSGSTDVQISTDGGVTFTTVETLAEVDAWVDGYEIDLSSYTAAAALIRFHYNDGGAWDYGFAIDNVLIYTPVANDLLVQSVGPNVMLYGGNYTPVVEVYNMGGSTETDFDVNVTITDGSANVVYNQTMNLTGQSLAPATAQDVTFTTPFSTPAVGSYNIEATVILAGDADNTNDSVLATLDVMAMPSYTGVAFAINSTGATFNTVDLGTGALTNVGAFDVTDFPMALKFMDSLMYAVRNSGALDLVYEDGSILPMGNITGMTGDPVAMAYDIPGAAAYVIDYDGANSNLYSLNLTTLAATSIGVICPGIIIACDMDLAGNMYAVNISNDTTYSIDIVTGAGTAIGPVGLDLNFGQDIAWDKASSTLYGMLYDNGGSVGVFGTIDVTTGAFTNVATVTDQIAGFAINTTLVGVEETEYANMAVYPNPAENYVNISVHGNATVTITDVTGRVVFAQEMSGIQQISTENFPTGVYVITSNENGNISSSKLIVR